LIALPTIIARDQATADPDVQLMLQVRQGDREAFEQLVARYYDRVLFVVEHLLGNGSQAEDLAQEVFLRVYRARRSYRPESKFSTWLFVIANNVVRNARRTLARRREVQASSCDSPRAVLAERADNDDREVEPAEASVRAELRETVRRAIGDLNSRQRTAVLLYHFKGLSYAEVADAMETSPCAAKALLHRARLSLRGQLQTYVNSN
jgi:RNA polymerase sigma-70 factor (ECF subfamily)